MSLRSTQELDAEGRREELVNIMEDGEEEYTAQELADEFEVSPSTIRGDLERLREGGYPVEINTSGPNGAHLYSMEDISYLGTSEFRNPEDIARYLEGEATGRHQEINNTEWEEKDSVKLLALNETGWGTQFADERALEGLAYQLESKKDEEGEEYFDDNFAMVLNGGILPRVPKWSYKTNRQYQRALGKYLDKNPNATVDNLEDPEALAEILGDELLDDLTEEEQERVLEEFLADLDDEIDLEEMKYKISNLREATDVVQSNIGTLYDAVGDEFDLYLHQGEQDRLNIEQLEELKIQEYSEQQKERMEGLKEKMESRNEMLQSLKERLQEGTGDYDEEIQEIEEQLEGGAKPSDLELEELGIDPGDFAEYEEALDLQAELLEDIREAELNLDAMMVEKALGSFADVMNRRYLEPDEASIMRALAELEYKEYLHSIGEVKDIASESELQHIEIGGYDIDVAHNMNLASDEPLISGYEKEIEKYRKRSDGDADLFLTGHHGVMHAEPYIHGRGEDANDHTWVVQLPTFLDKDALEEHGEDAGLNLLKDVKRLNKDLFSSAATMLEMKVEEGPDGELRKRLVIEGWDEEYLKNLGRQLNGETFPGRDFTEDGEMEHIVARGDDQIGAPHSLRFLYEPLIEEVIDEDFHNIREWMDDYDIDPAEVTVVEGGDAFQGNDIYPAQMTEGGMHQGRQELELKEAIVSQFEDVDVEFETREDYYEYLEDNDLDSLTLQALDYLEVRNRAQVPITSLGKQGERVEELVENYEELIEDGASFIGVDGNHFNRNHEGMEEAKRISQMISSELKKSDRVQTASGLQDGDGTFEIGDLQVRIKHRPTGRGRSNRSKQVNQTLEADTDVVVNADKHIPGFSFKDGVQYIMPGSAQATNLFVKSFTDAPAESGAVYLSRSTDPEKNHFRYEHRSVKGFNPLSKKD